MTGGHPGHVRRLLAGAALAALAVHMMAVARVPGAKMADWRARMGEGLPVNRMAHPATPVAAVPGDGSFLPGLLTSFCLLDLSAGPVEIRAPMPAGFWSASLMDDRGTVFFSTGNSQWGARPLRLLVGASGQTLPGAVPASLTAVSAPGGEALLLIRMAVPRGTALAGLDGLRRQAVCAPYKP